MNVEIQLLDMNIPCYNTGADEFFLTYLFYGVSLDEKLLVNASAKAVREVMDVLDKMNAAV